jgi:hypothetical protein
MSEPDPWPVDGQGPFHVPDRSQERISFGMAAAFLGVAPLGYTNLDAGILWVVTTFGFLLIVATTFWRGLQERRYRLQRTEAVRLLWEKLERPQSNGEAPDGSD